MTDQASTDDGSGGTSLAFVELRSNLAYARDLVRGGQNLELLQVQAFDVADLYRAAWVQAVAALDQWVHRELYDRALGFALNVDVPRPRKFLTLKIPMQLFEDVHHHAKTLPEVFESHLRNQFGYLSFQQPDKIKDALAHVTDVQLWPAVAKRLTDEHGAAVKPDDVQGTLRDIVGRRNRIAHEADRDPNQVHAKQAITAQATSDAIEHIQRTAAAILHVMGPSPAEVERSHATTPVSTDRREPSKNELYQQFWTRFRAIVRSHGWSKAAPPAQYWWDLPSGVTGVSWMVAFTTFGCRSELNFNDPDAAVNLARWEALAVRSAQIIDHFGDDLIFDELPNNKSCRIETRLIGPSIEDRERWSDILLWMEDTQVRLRAAIDAVGGVPH